MGNESEDDWRSHKLWITKEIESLKKGQELVRTELNNISTAVTVLQTKMMVAAFVTSVVITYGLPLITGKLAGG